jgi:hypothetical protein
LKALPIARFKYVKILKERRGAVLVGQHGLNLIQSPVDPNVGIIKAHGPITFWRIVIRTFIDDLSVGLAGDKSMQKTGRDQQLFAILKAQIFADPLPKSR